MSAVRRGIPFLVAAPSGTGKTTVCRAVMERDDGLCFSVSHTTRKPREGERDGVDYTFVDASEFRRLVDAEAFVEHAEYAGNLYGTSWDALEGPIADGHDLLVEIEVRGAGQVRERREDVYFIFLLPPSMEELERRLRKRGTDSEEVIQKRLAEASNELAAADIFDFAVVNDDLETAVDAVLTVIREVRAGRAGSLEARFGREVVLQRWRRGTDPHVGDA